MYLIKPKHNGRVCENGIYFIITTESIHESVTRYQGSLEFQVFH